MSWGRIRGHDALVESFAQVVARGRLAHAFLFVGPSGIGKRLFAIELAKTLLCEAPKRKRFEACGLCPSCHQVEAGTHPDFAFAQRPEGKIEFPIELMRELSEKLALKPARGGYKVAVLDDADDLNDASANCFLKTLEEPPPNSLLILIGTSAEQQLPTIVSRCQVVRFAPLPAETVAELLVKQGIDASTASRLSRVGGGSPGRAVELADPELWAFRRDLVRELAQPRPDTVGLSRRWIEFVEQAGTDSASQRRRAALVLRLLVDLLDDALGIGIGLESSRAEASDQEAAKALAARHGTDRLMAMVDRCLEAEYQNDRKVQLSLILEALIDSLGQGAARPG